MANLLYVTPELLNKLQTHKAYRFWSPIMEAFPIRPVPLEERQYHPRKTKKVEEGYLYLTTEMKFVYCRDGLCSFLYENQDLSFRLSPVKGVLQTVDGKQFAAILGRVAEVSSTSDVNLIDTDKCYHPLFDSGAFATGSADAGVAADEDEDGSPAPKRRARATRKAPATKKVAAKKTTKKDLILGKYEKSVCDALVKFRTSSKKSYTYLADKYDVPVDDVKEIIKLYASKSRRRANAAGQQAVAKVPKKIRDQIVRMKKVSKKSYSFLAQRFKLKIDVVKDICAQHLTRPRHR